MKKIMLVSLLLIFSLVACSKVNNNESKDKKESSKVEEKKEMTQKDENTSDDSKKVDEFVKKGIEKKEAELELKDYPLGFFDFTSDKNQEIKLTYKESKEALSIKLIAGQKTPIYLDEKLQSIKIVSSDEASKDATIKVENHKKSDSNEIKNGLYKVSFTDEVKPGKVAFQSTKKDAIIVKLSKYDNIEPLALKEHDKKSFRTEDVTLMAGDKVIVNGSPIKIIDTVQENIDSLDKEKSK